MICTTTHHTNAAARDEDVRGFFFASFIQKAQQNARQDQDQMMQVLTNTVQGMDQGVIRNFPR